MTQCHISGRDNTCTDVRRRTRSRCGSGRISVDWLWAPPRPGPPVGVCSVPVRSVAWRVRLLVSAGLRMELGGAACHTTAARCLSCPIIPGGLGPHPDTLIRMGGGKGGLFFYFKAKTLTPTENCLVMPKPECGLPSFKNTATPPG